MITRYMRPEMGEIWTDRSKYKEWLRVETAVCAALVREKLIPQKAWRELKPKLEKLLKSGGVDPKRVLEIEEVTRHDIIAFTTAVAEKVGPNSRYFHYGLTSSDVIDTALALQIQAAGKIILKGIDDLIRTLDRKARETKSIPTIGRSHGIFAEPTSFGLKFLGFSAEWKRNRTRMQRALETMRIGKASGAVGVNAHFSPTVETKILKSLGLKRELVSTQIIPRDRHAEFFTAAALCGAAIERLGVELRLLQRSEVGEVIEGFAKGQKGSSAMPHKRNPITGENLTGLSRLLRSYSQAALEDVVLWHERDISHSSVERIIVPDACCLLDYALHRAIVLVKDLGIQKNRIAENLKDAGQTVYSGHLLLALVSAGVTRENAYAWIQECALKSFQEKSDFLKLVENHKKIREVLSPKDVRKIGSLSHQLRHVSEIYKWEKKFSY